MLDDYDDFDSVDGEDLDLAPEWFKKKIPFKDVENKEIIKIPLYFGKQRSTKKNSYDFDIRIKP